MTLIIIEFQLMALFNYSSKCTHCYSHLKNRKVMKGRKLLVLQCRAKMSGNAVIFNRLLSNSYLISNANVQVIKWFSEYQA